MRVVIDTNVLVSGLFGLYTYPARVIDLLYIGRLSCLFDDRILLEYQEVLSRPKFRPAISEKEQRDLLGYITQTGTHVLAEPVEGFAYSAPDLNDLPFIEVAIAGKSQYIITGNYMHFAFFENNPWEIQVVSPSSLYHIMCK